MDADSSYGGSDTAQDSTCGNENVFSESPPNNSINKIIINTEENPYYNKNEVSLPVNADETDFKNDPSQPNHPHYLSTANLNINETLEHHSNLEAMSKQYKSTSYLNAITPPNHRKSGLDNPAFDVDEDGEKTKRNGDLNTTTPSKNDETTLTEAVNLELINMKPGNGKDVTGVYENGNGMTTIPLKPDADAEMGNPYNEYFVPVNQHKKFMRGEKLYVTMDKRNVKKKNRCLCWGVCISIILAALIVGILAAVGVIGNKQPVQEVTSRQFGGTTEVKKGGIFGLPSDLNTMVPKLTPGPPSSTPPYPLTTEMSEISVQRALESQLKIDNFEYIPEYKDKSSQQFKDLASLLEDRIKDTLFTNEELQNGPARIKVKIMELTDGSVVARYRIAWEFKEGMENTKDPIDISTLEKRMSEKLQENYYYMDSFHIAEDSFSNQTTRVLDSCKIQNYGCEHECVFDYDTALFICLCPEGSILSEDGKHCQAALEPNAEPNPEPSAEPEPTSEPQAEPEPTSEPKAEPEPTAEPKAELEPSAEPEPSSEPEPSAEPEPNAEPEPKSEPEPTAEPKSEPEPNSEPEPTAEPKAEPEPNSEPEPTAEPKAEPEPTAEPKSEPEPTAEPKSEPEPTAEPKAEAEPTAEPSSEPEPTSEPVAELEAIQSTNPPSAEPAPEPVTIQPMEISDDYLVQTTTERFSKIPEAVGTVRSETTTTESNPQPEPTTLPSFQSSVELTTHSSRENSELQMITVPPTSTEFELKDEMMEAHTEIQKQIENLNNTDGSYLVVNKLNTSENSVGSKHIVEITEKNMPTNETHQNILLSETPEYTNNIDNMSPFLPEIENDTFVDTLISDEHFIDKYSMTGNEKGDDHKPPSLENDQLNKTNPLDPNPTDAETSIVLDENTTYFSPPPEKNHEEITPEILNNVHSNSYFDKYETNNRNPKELEETTQFETLTQETSTIQPEEMTTKTEDEMEDSASTSSSTEDLIAMETTTYGKNSKSIKYHNKKQDLEIDTKKMFSYDFDLNSSGYSVKETYVDATTTPRLFVTKHTTTEIPTTDNSNDILYVDKFSKETAESTTAEEESTEFDYQNNKGDFIFNPSKCDSEQFQCIHGTTRNGTYCISEESRCDAIQDCSDNSDEENCEECLDSFLCENSGECVQRHVVCDGILNCRDGTDEEECSSWECDPNEFSCGANSRCIPETWKCDGKPQCKDGSDELNCHTKCSKNQFHCPKEGICIRNTWRCDGTPDCKDGEDEVDCNCKDGEFKCSFGGGCIDIDRVCDGRTDCVDKSDEWNCITTTENSTLKVNWHNESSYICSEDYNSEIAGITCFNMGYPWGGRYEAVPIPDKHTNVLKLKKHFWPSFENRSLILEHVEKAERCSRIVKLKCSDPVCGMEDERHWNRKENWQTLGLLSNNKKNIHCTASFLTPFWAITAYSCLHGTSDGSVEIKADEWVIKKKGDQSGIKAIFGHPKMKYRDFYYENDIALLEFVEPTERRFGCLPKHGNLGTHRCVTPGWNQDEIDGSAKTQYIQSLKVPFMNIQECNSTKHFNSMLSMDKICVESNENINKFCFEDLGAPIMCEIRGKDKWELHAIQSYSNECEHKNHPLIYTAIDGDIRSWIQNIVGEIVTDL